VEQHVAVLALVIAAYALGFIVSALVFYWLIRLAVTHALRSHTYWLQKRERTATTTIPTVR
jgi:hypothetical protein